MTFQQLVDSSGLSPDRVRRSLSWLGSKSLVETKEATSRKLVVKQETPPEVLLSRLVSKNGGVSFDELRKKFGSGDEFSAALGRARSNGWIRVESKDGKPFVSQTDSSGPRALEALIESLSAGAGEVEVPNERRRLLDDLMRRGYVMEETVSTVSVRTTAAGDSAALGSQEEYLDRLTPEALASGGWRKPLRPIDVEAPAAKLYPGRRHPVRDFIREVREVYLSMGFTELEGNSIQPSFWNFDALFIPQDHPGREMQDTFYISGYREPGLKRKGVVDRVASTHEKGGASGSRGWGYAWSTEEARRLVLRTHNTVLTVRSLFESGEREARVFAVSKVYRNESLDYKHIAEFHQMDGIIVGEGLSVRHLMGFLTEFYKKLGMRGVKLWPTFFPYTEPSLQVMGYSEIVKDWIELGGSGVFRPEVTVPLGVRVPVLAWGPGIERLMLLKYGLDDIRSLYDSDLGWLRSRVEFAGRRN